MRAVPHAGSSQQVLHLEVGQPSTGAPALVKEAAAKALQVVPATVFLANRAQSAHVQTRSDAAYLSVTCWMACRATNLAIQRPSGSGRCANA